MTQGFLIDTNVASEQMKSRPEPTVSEWFNTQPEDVLFMSAITIGEISRGIFLLPQGKRRDQLEHWLESDLVPRFSDRILPVTTMVAQDWGALSARRKLAGRPLAMADGLIAATAVGQRLTLVTRNTTDFAELGIPLIDPWKL